MTLLEEGHGSVAAAPPAERSAAGRDTGRPSPRRPGLLARVATTLPARRLVDVVVVASVVAGLALRTVAPPTLWLDEAQGVTIAGLPLTEMVAALRTDGAPPLYYVLLHGWMALVGTSDVAVRGFSVLASVLTVPLLALLAHRVAGPGAWRPALVLAALSPFALRYAAEARMYALVELLAVLGGLALVAVLRGAAAGRRTATATAGLVLCTAALVLTHYWALPMLAVVGAALLLGWRRAVPGAARAAVAVAAGGLALVPWLPVLAHQTVRTAAPWGRPAGAEDVLGTAVDWAGQRLALAPTLALGLLWLAVLGALAVRQGGGLLLSPRQSPAALRWAGGGALAVLVLGVALASSGGQPVAVRYTAVVLPAVLVCAAAGVALLRPRTALVVLLVAALGGAYSGYVDARALRTDVRSVAGVLATSARPGDVVVTCPDQLGPALAREMERQDVAPVLRLAFPTGEPFDLVDWTDYVERREGMDVAGFARDAATAAGDGAVWLVEDDGYLGYGRSCALLAQSLAVVRPSLTPTPLLDRGDAGARSASPGARNLLAGHYRRGFATGTSLTRFDAPTGRPPLPASP